jgi:hypothetical protein
MYVRLLVVAGFTLFTLGCSSMAGHHKVEDLYDMPLGTEPVRVYQAPIEEVQQAAIYSMNQTGLQNVEEHTMGENGWYITGEIGYSWRSNGQFVRIASRVEPDSNPVRTQVFYNSLKRFDVNVTEDLNVIQNKLLNLMDSYIESE